MFTDVSESRGGQGFQLASLPTSPGCSRSRGQTVAATSSLELFLFMQPLHFWLNAATHSTHKRCGSHLEFKGTHRLQQKLGAAPGCTKDINIHICLRGLEVAWWSLGLKSCWRKSMPITFSTQVQTQSTLSTIYRVSGKGSVEGQGKRAPSSQHADGKDGALLPAQDADGIPGCHDPGVCLFSSFSSSLFFAINNGNLLLTVLKAGSSRWRCHWSWFFRSSSFLM